MKDIVGIVGLLVVSFASLTYSNPADYENGVGKSIYGDKNPFAPGGSISRSVQALIKRKNSELSASNGNSPSSNGNYDNEDNKLNHHSLSRSSISEDNNNDKSVGSTNIVSDISKSFNSNINTINGRLFVNGGEYEIFNGGDKVLDLPCGTYTGLKSWKLLEGEERQNAEELIKNQINGIPMKLDQTLNTDTILPEALKKDDSHHSDEEVSGDNKNVNTGEVDSAKAGQSLEKEQASDNEKSGQDEVSGADKSKAPEENKD